MRNPIFHCVSTHFLTWEKCIRCICMYLHMYNKTMQLGGTKGMSNTYTQITKKRKMIFRKGEFYGVLIAVTKGCN